MPPDTIPAPPNLPPLPTDLALPVPPPLVITPDMQAALEAALAQLQSTFAAFTAALTPVPIGADTVPAAGDKLGGPTLPTILPGPTIMPAIGATIPGALHLMQDMRPVELYAVLDFPELLSASLTAIPGNAGTLFTASLADTLPGGASISLGGGAWLSFGQISEINGADH